MVATRSKGFTLLETLVGLALTGMLLVGLAAASSALMRVSREGEVFQRLQRELVFAVEAIEAELRIAKDLVPASDPSATEWDIIQVHHDGTAYQARTVTIRFEPETRQLLMGGRVLARNVASFSLEASERDDLIQLVVETVDRVPMVSSSKLPLRLEARTAMRNHAFIAGGQGELITSWDAKPTGLQGQRYETMIFEWFTSMPTTYKLYYQDGNKDWQERDGATGTPSDQYIIPITAETNQLRWQVGETYRWRVIAYENSLWLLDDTGVLEFVPQP